MDAFFSSPISPSPSTPLSHRSKGYDHSFRPLNSSPLAQSSVSPFSSPVAEAQARRQSQYKSRVPSGASRARNVSRSAAASSSSPSGSGSNSLKDKNSQKALARDRFKIRCLERAQQARAVARSRRRSEPSSDGFDDGMNEDVEETDDDIMQDELFRRIMVNQSHQARHAYRRSYYAEVGSSFDPDLEDIAVWEHELDAKEAESNSTQEPRSPVMELTPEELEQAELEAYAEECERQAALADFEDIPVEELLTLDDTELSELMMDKDVDMDF